jgi:hypothetical protein
LAISRYLSNTFHFYQIASLYDTIDAFHLRSDHHVLLLLNRYIKHTLEIYKYRIDNNSTNIIVNHKQRLYKRDMHVQRELCQLNTVNLAFYGMSDNHHLLLTNLDGCVFIDGHDNTSWLIHYLRCVPGLYSKTTRLTIPGRRTRGHLLNTTTYDYCTTEFITKLLEQIKSVFVNLGYINMVNQWCLTSHPGEYQIENTRMYNYATSCVSLLKDINRDIKFNGRSLRNTGCRYCDGVTGPFGTAPCNNVTCVSTGDVCFRCITKIMSWPSANMKLKSFGHWKHPSCLIPWISNISNILGLKPGEKWSDASVEDMLSVLKYGIKFVDTSVDQKKVLEAASTYNWCSSPDEASYPVTLLYDPTADLLSWDRLCMDLVTECPHINDMRERFISLSVHQMAFNQTI